MSTIAEAAVARALRSAPKKAHPSKARDIEANKTAVSFNVHLRRSPTSKVNVPAKTLREAVALADQVTAEYGANGRRAMIYSILPTGASLLVDPDLVEAARRGEFDIVPAAAEPTPAPVEEPAAAPVAVAAAALNRDARRRAALAAISDPEKTEERPARKPKAAKAEKPAKEPKAPKAPKVAKEVPAGEAPKKSARVLWAEREAAAERGEMPSAPDLSAPSHQRYKKHIAAVKEAAEKRDVDALLRIDVPRKGDTRTAIMRFRDLAIKAITKSRGK